MYFVYYRAYSFQKSYDKAGGEVTSMDRRCVNEAECSNHGCIGALSFYDCEYCCSDDLCNTGSNTVIISVGTLLLSSVLTILFVKS